MAKQFNTFLGANTPLGFVSLFDELYDPYGTDRAFLIKGGPGTGKSTLMRRIADEAVRSGYDTEYVHCGSDPHSLDAVRVPALSLSVCDATPPHTVEPQFPGVCENLWDLGAFWNSDNLRAQAKDIRRLTVENSMLHRRATRFLAAAGALSEELQAFCAPFVLEEKLNGYALRFCNRELPKKKNAAPGRRRRRFFSGYTPDGYVFFEDTIRTLAARVLALQEDGTGTAGRLLEYIANRACAAGYDVIVGLRPLHPKADPDVLIVPEASLALVCLHRQASLQTPPDRSVHMRRFFAPEFLREHKNYLAFQEEMVSALLEQNHVLLHEARQTHDALERHYMDAMDFDALRAFGDRVLTELFKKNP